MATTLRSEDVALWDKADFRLDSERHSEAASRAACGVPSLAVLWAGSQPGRHERWLYSLTVTESIQRMEPDSPIRMCVDSAGNFTYPWRDKCCA